MSKKGKEIKTNAMPILNRDGISYVRLHQLHQLRFFDNLPESIRYGKMNKIVQIII